MNREIAIAGICVLATIVIAWILGHPDRLAGTILLLVVFAGIVLAARLRGNRAPRTSFRLNRRSSRKPR